MHRGPVQKRLLAEEIEPAVAQLRIWEADPKAECHCPRCGIAGVNIRDCSARPHVEWYLFTCKSCGLDAPLHRASCPGYRD